MAVIVGDLLVDFYPGTGGAVDLVIHGADRAGREVELARVGFTPEQLDGLLTQGREALWRALGLLTSEGMSQ